MPKYQGEKEARHLGKKNKHKIPKQEIDFNTTPLRDYSTSSELFFGKNQRKNREGKMECIAEQRHIIARTVWEWRVWQEENPRRQNVYFCERCGDWLNPKVLNEPED